jgi:ankyrin repeat protein
VYEGKAKPRRARLPHEDLLSRPQSTTLITPHNQVSLFKHTLDPVGVGFAFLPESSGMRRFIKLDTGTVRRPYDHETREAAERFLAAKRTDYFPDFDSFSQALIRTTRYNEVMAGLYHELDSSCIIITQDNLSSRAAAQFLAAETREALVAREEKRRIFGEGTEEFKGDPESIEGYKVPLMYYLPHEPKNYHAYSPEEQEADKTEVQKIIDEKSYSEYFSRGDFSFLLIAPNPQEALALTWKGKPVMIEILQKGLFHIAEGLLKRASRGDLVSYLTTLTEELCFDPEDIPNRLPPHQTHLKPHLMKKSLRIAAEKGDLEAVRSLIAGGANVNQKNQYGKTPLLLAAKKGHLEIVNALLARGADVNQANGYGDTPLLLAAQNGRLAIVEALVTRGAKVNQATLRGGTPLLLAAQNGHLEIVNALLARGADVNQANGYGDTPLLLAAQNGPLKIVEALLERSANVNQPTRSGKTPLLIAAEKGRLKIVEALITGGANVNQKIGIESVLTWAVRNRHVSIVKALLTQGLDLNQKNPAGITPFMLAEGSGHPEIIREFIKHRIIKYIESLSKDTNYYRSFWGRHFGYNAGQKRAAAQALLRSMDGTQAPQALLTHKGALTSGRLGDIYKLYRKHFPRDQVETASLPPPTFTSAGAGAGAGAGAPSGGGSSPSS